MKNKELILFAYWCARNRAMDFSKFMAAMNDLKKGLSLKDPVFTNTWGIHFPWIYLRLMTDYENDLEVLERWERSGVQLVHILDLRYPVQLFKLEDPPTLLFGKGDWSCLRNLSLAIVGSREPSSLSLQWIESEVGKFLNQEAVTIISGGARGVDLAAHRIAIRKKCPTVVLFPSGLEQMYPQTWSESREAWALAVLKSGGLLLSEYSPPKLMNRSHFHERNRLISGLAAATLLVECRVRSGTMVTAQMALAQNRPLFVIPSHPFDSNARGGLDLVRSGGEMICDAQELSNSFRSETKSWKEELTTNWYGENSTH